MKAFRPECEQALTAKLVQYPNTPNVEVVPELSTLRKEILSITGDETDISLSAHWLQIYEGQ